MAYKGFGYVVDSCPESQEKVTEAATRLNCSVDVYGRSQYVCVPNENLTAIVEFCYTKSIVALYQNGTCLRTIQDGFLDQISCKNFTKGCPTEFYRSTDLYKYPACSNLNTEDRCFLAASSCNSSYSNTSKAAIDDGSANIGTILGVVIPLLVLVGILIAFLFCKLKRDRDSGAETNDEEENKFLPEIPTRDKALEQRNTPIENLPSRTEEELKIEMERRLEDKEFLERYQKYLAEESVKVCPISQILIVGEHGVGKTTLLYRLMGKNDQNEMKKIEETRGVECHKEKESFIVTKDELKVNKDGKDNMCLSPMQFEKFLKKITNDAIRNRKETENQVQPTRSKEEERPAKKDQAHTGQSKSTKEPKKEERTKHSDNKQNAEHNTEEMQASDKEHESDTRHASDKVETREKERASDTHHASDKVETREKERASDTHHASDKVETREKERVSDTHHVSKREQDRKPDVDLQPSIPKLMAKLEERRKAISQFGNEDEIILDVLDFAGQGEYYASHQTYIRKDAIFIVVFDTSKDFNQRSENRKMKETKNESARNNETQYLCDRPDVPFNCWSPKDFLRYWLNTIRTHGGSSENIIFVGTHKDPERKDSSFNLESLNENLLSENYRKPVLIDLHGKDEATDNELTEIKRFVCDIVWNSKKQPQPAKWINYAYIFDILKKEFPILTIEKVLEMTDFLNYEMSDNVVADMLHFFHTSGRIIFFNSDTLKQLVIIDIQWFIDCFKYIISDRKHVDKDCKVASVSEIMMLNEYRKKGILEISIYEKLLAKRGELAEQYQKELGNYMKKLGLMFHLENFEIDGENKPIEGWYIPSINFRIFEPDEKEYDCEETSPILCIKFTDYLPHDLFGRVLAACVNSGHWQPYNFLLYKNGADMRYQYPGKQNKQQIYLFTSRKIITVQFIMQTSEKFGPAVKQEITSKLKYTLHNFYTGSNVFKVGYLCCKRSGYKEESESHFTSINDSYCQACEHNVKRDVLKRAESFWNDDKKDTDEEFSNTSNGKINILQNTFEVYFHLVKHSVGFQDVPPSDISTGCFSELDVLVQVGKRLKILSEPAGHSSMNVEDELRDIMMTLKEVSCTLDKKFCGLRKEVFFLWTEKKYTTEAKIRGLPNISLIVPAKTKVKFGKDIALHFRMEGEILQYMWLKKSLLEDEFWVLYPNDKIQKKYEFKFQKKKRLSKLTIKKFAKEDEGYYYVAVKTKEGVHACKETITTGIIEREEKKPFFRKGRLDKTNWELGIYNVWRTKISDEFSTLTDEEVYVLFCFLCSDSGPPDFTDTEWLDLLNGIRQIVYGKHNPVTHVEVQQTLDGLKLRDHLWEYQDRITKDTKDETMYRIASINNDMPFRYSSYDTASVYLRSCGYNRKTGEKCVISYRSDHLLILRLQMNILTQVTMEDTSIYYQIHQILNVSIQIQKNSKDKRKEFLMDLRREGKAVHYRGRSHDSVDHVTWLWRYDDEGKPDIVRSCVGLHPHWDIYIIDNKPHRKPSKKENITIKSS